MDNKIPDSTIVSELCGLINSHAKILYNMAGGTDLEKIQISCDLVAQMIACATESFQTCPLLKKYYPDATFAVQDKLYPSVFSFTPQLRTYPFFLLTMMKVGTGIVSKDCKTDSECDAGFECLGTKCTKSMTRQHNAYGTGLSFDLDSGKFSQSDETKGTWVESRWDSQGMRIFKMQSWAQDLIPFGIGLILTFLSLLIFCKFDVLNWFESMEKKSQ